LSQPQNLFLARDVSKMALLSHSLPPGFEVRWPIILSDVREEHMHRRIVLNPFAIVALVIALLPGSAMGQQKSLKEQLVGTWIYVSSTITRPDGSKTDRPNLKGTVIYTSDGHFAFVSVRSDLPKLASNDTARATAEEAQAVVAGSIAYYGTYTINEADKVLTAKVEGSTFANLLGGPEQKRIITSLTADELRFTNPRTPAGNTLEFVWKRAK
jgi:hypothetical protein